MPRAEAHAKLLAAHKLLMEETTTREKFSHVRTLVLGLNPKIDGALAELEQHLSTWDKLENGEIIHLSAEHLPENTEEEKKRKKWLLLFITSWKQLQGEVVRVEAEMAKIENASTAGKASGWGKIFGAAKGPLGVITVLAVGAVMLQQTSVEITIKNEGCATMYPGGSIPPLPGFSMPSEPIASGGSAVMTIPPLTLNVDGSQKGTVALTALNYSFSFQLPSSISSVSFNGTNLLGTKTEVHLSEKDTHSLVLRCN